MTYRTLILASATALAFTACGDKEAETVVDRTDRAVDNAAADAGDSMDRMGDQGDDDMEIMDVGVDMRGLDDIDTVYDVVNASGIRIGSITLEHNPDGVEVEFDVTSLPEGTLAVHFHENGACDGPDFTSAGGHFNPEGVMHGRDSETGPHAGDMPNVEVPRSGILKTQIENTHASILGHDGLPALLDANGSSLIIHAEADDYKSQPSGDAGTRIACAVIAR